MKACSMLFAAAAAATLLTASLSAQDGGPVKGRPAPFADENFPQIIEIDPDPVLPQSPFGGTAGRAELELVADPNLLIARVSGVPESFLAVATLALHGGAVQYYRDLPPLLTSAVVLGFFEGANGLAQLQIPHAPVPGPLMLYGQGFALHSGGYLRREAAGQVSFVDNDQASCLLH